MNRVIQKMEQIRKSKGITMKHIANHCGKSLAWYSNIARGQARCSVDDMLLIAEAMDVDPKIFFDRKLNVSLQNERNTA